MKIIKQCNYNIIFDNIEDIKEKVNYEQFIEDNFSDFPYDTIWAEPIEEDFKQICVFFGLDNVETCWDVSYSQGSGASFEADFYTEKIDLDGLLKYAPKDKELHNTLNYLIDELDSINKEIEGKITFGIIKRMYHKRYCHENTMDFYFLECNNDEIYDERIKDDLIQPFKDLAYWFFMRLRYEYDYISSEEFILQYIVDNEIEIPEKYIKEEYKNELTTNN